MNLLSLLLVTCLISAVFCQSMDGFRERSANSDGNLHKGPAENVGRQKDRQPIYRRFLSHHAQFDDEDQGSLKDESEIHDKIVGGQKAYHGEFPWQASVDILSDNQEYSCGAAIINEYWLLSAAHCFTFHLLTAVVTVGNYHRKQTDQGEQEFQVEAIIKHDSYKGHPHDFDSDIALIKIKPGDSGQGIQFNGYVQPIRLPEQGASLHEGTRCLVSGWGKRLFEMPSSEDVLRKVEVPIIKQQICQQLYAGFLVPYVPQHMFCAGYQHGGSGSCKGDSGGGVVCKHRGENIIYGIVSWGYNCEQPGFPGVYTLVPPFVPWIRSTMATNSL